MPRNELSSAPQTRGKARKPFYSAISSEIAVSVTKAEQPEGEETKNEYGQSFLATLDAGGLVLASDSESVVVLDAGAAASLICFRRLERRNCISQRNDYQKASTHPSSARFRLGDVRLGDVHHATDVPVGIAKSEGTSTAFAPDADIPALLRKGAL